MAEEKEKLSKATPFSPLGREVGQPGFMLSSTFVKNQRDKDLTVPNRWCTYNQMLEDSCVTEALVATQTLIFLSLYKGKWEPSEANTSASREAADYLNHQMHNMSGMTWADACQQFVTHVQDGYSLNEIVAKKATTGPYSGMAELVKFGHRLPSSVYAWVWDENIREVKKVIQKPLKTMKDIVAKDQKSSYLGDITEAHQIVTDHTYRSSYPILDMNKMLHMRYRPKGSDPEGNSPLASCYRPWKHKFVYEEYRLIGVTRDFGGIPVLRAPSQLFENAAQPDKYPNDALALQTMKDQLSNLHAGKEAFLLLTSDVLDGTTIPEYDIKFLGIEGGGKQFDISQIVKDLNSEIYSAFSASYLNMGKDGKTGSYNLSTTGFNIHAFVLEKEIIHCVSQIESLGKRLIQASMPRGQSLPFRDMPRFRPADPDQLSLEEGGKFIQRLGSVMKLTPKMLTAVCKLMGLPHEGIEELDFTDKGDTKAGTGQGTSGQGAKPQQNSSTNLENKALVTEEAVQLFEDAYGNLRCLETGDLFKPEEQE